ncbi:hypothetical protein SLS62_002927 [Diatrype stigma]|uniref:FAD-binding domain-containing protein n=1 Tax=Diatrype stigma TaxID=117547 RepID=A0AAN9UXI0_9PEZI
MQSLDMNSRVIVIGAGPAGLLTAQALKKAECLPDELSSQVEDTQIDDHKPSPDDTLPMFNTQSGELLRKVPAPFMWGKRLAAVSSNGRKATATFRDGTSESADMLIGSDGAHSLVREFLVGPERAALQSSPLAASVAMAKLPAFAAEKFKQLAPRFLLGFHPLGYFCWIGGELYFRPDSNQILICTGPAILEDLKKRTESFSEPFNICFQSIPEGTKCWHSKLSYWVPEPWDNRNGTVTLVGDAAHPMTYRVLSRTV